MLYASTKRLGCFLETLARFRIDLSLQIELADIAGADDFHPLGKVPSSWLEGRRMGQGSIHGYFAHISDSDFISVLRSRLARKLVQSGVSDFDVSHLQGPNRDLTQAVSRVVYELSFQGIAYFSKYGLDIVNWAIFEPFMLLINDPEGEQILPTDPDLQLALDVHGLRLS